MDFDKLLARIIFLGHPLNVKSKKNGIKYLGNKIHRITYGMNLESIFLWFIIRFFGAPIICWIISGISQPSNYGEFLNRVWHDVTTSDVTIFVFARWRDVTRKVVFLLWCNMWLDDLAWVVTLFLGGEVKLLFSVFSHCVTNRWTDGWMYKRSDGKTEGGTDRQTDGPTNQRTNIEL